MAAMVGVRSTASVAWPELVPGAKSAFTDA
jgi:hypothetical protein